MKKSVVLILFILLSVIAVASLGVAIYSYSQVQTVKKSTDSSRDSDQKILDVISATMVLPEEKPTVINITDRDKLQDQEFFKKAQNGDKVIIFEGIRRIILYRPSIKKIVDVAPLVFSGGQNASAQAELASPTPTLSRRPQKEATDSSQSVGVEEQGNFKLQQ
jgi:hypothetical protein